MSDIPNVSETKQADLPQEITALKETTVPQKIDAPKRKPVRKFLKTFVDVKKWTSYDEVSSNVKNTASLFRRLIYTKPTEIRQETYEEAIVRLGLTAEQVVVRKNNFLHSALVYALFVVGFFAYFVYMAINFKILAACFSLLLMVLMTLATYREHFWYMQMQKKRLGCNFRDWLAFVLRRS